MSGLTDAALFALKLVATGLAGWVAMWLLTVLAFTVALKWEARTRRRNGGAR